MKKVLALVLAFLMLASLISCGGNSPETGSEADSVQNEEVIDSEVEETEEETEEATEEETEEATEEETEEATEEETEEATEEETEEATEEETEEATEKETVSEFPSALKATKIGNIDHAYLYTGDGGIYYRDGDKYGIMSYDGKKDTGAIYSYCKTEEDYFIVSDKSSPDNPTDIESLNFAGLVDVEGNELIPQEYASIDVLNEHFAKVCEVTEQTENEDEALIYYTDRMFSLTAQEGDIFYKGNWYIYDLETGEKVEGISGTEPDYIYAYGKLIRSYDEDRNIIYITADGEVLSNGVKVFEDGSYSINEGKTGAVYDTHGNELFTFTNKDFIPSSITGDYYLASFYANGESSYVLLDKTGKTVSAEFDEYVSVYGNMVRVGDKFYDFEGNVLFDGAKFDSVYEDNDLGIAWMLVDDDVNTIISNDYTVLAEIDEDADNEPFVDSSSFTAYDKDHFCYCYKDGDYTIEGYSFAPWLIKVSGPNYTYDVVDSISGETLIDGYDSYSYSVDKGSAIYVYAKADNYTYDIYKINY